MWAIGVGVVGGWLLVERRRERLLVGGEGWVLFARLGW